MRAKQVLVSILMQHSCISESFQSSQQWANSLRVPATAQKRSADGDGLHSGHGFVADVVHVDRDPAAEARAAERPRSPLLDLLVTAGLAGKAHVFHEKGATLEILRGMSVHGYAAFFSLTLAQAHRLKILVDDSGASPADAHTGSLASASARPSIPETSDALPKRPWTKAVEPESSNAHSISGAASSSVKAHLPSVPAPDARETQSQRSQRRSFPWLTANVWWATYWTMICGLLHTQHSGLHCVCRAKKCAVAAMVGS